VRATIISRTGDKITAQTGGAGSRGISREQQCDRLNMSIVAACEEVATLCATLALRMQLARGCFNLPAAKFMLKIYLDNPSIACPSTFRRKSSPPCRCAGGPGGETICQKTRIHLNFWYELGSLQYHFHERD